MAGLGTLREPLSASHHPESPERDIRSEPTEEHSTRPLSALPAPRVRFARPRVRFAPHGLPSARIAQPDRATGAIAPVGMGCSTG